MCWKTLTNTHTQTPIHTQTHTHSYTHVMRKREFGSTTILLPFAFPLNQTLHPSHQKEGFIALWGAGSTQWKVNGTTAAAAAANSAGLPLREMRERYRPGALCCPILLRVSSLRKKQLSVSSNLYPVVNKVLEVFRLMVQRIHFGCVSAFKVSFHRTEDLFVLIHF
jgi:hypothetical protein